MQFLHTPELALGSLALILGAWMAGRRLRFRRRGVYFPGTAWVEACSSPLRHIPWLPRLLALGSMLALLTAAAGPVRRVERSVDSARGIDIALVLDVSTSMSARDFPPSGRLEAARKVLHDFIDRRTHDRLSLVTFAAVPYVVCPLTTDRYTLASLLDSVSLAPFDQDGTAIGLALSSAVNRLRQGTARSRVAILLTDGVNNRGEISPLQAAAFCKAHGIKVYAVAIGTDRETEVMARAADGSPTWIRSRVDYDLTTLQEIARTTGGKAFSASDASGLGRIWSEIDSLEKTVLEHRTVAVDEDLSPALITLALGLAALTALLELALALL